MNCGIGFSRRENCVLSLFTFSIGQFGGRSQDFATGIDIYVFCNHRNVSLLSLRYLRNMLIWDDNLPKGLEIWQRANRQIILHHKAQVVVQLRKYKSWESTIEDTHHIRLSS